MFRLDGDVFLLGTAIAAPLKSIKIATICALSRQEPLEGDSRGGTRIVANRRSYSACARECKSRRECGIAHIGVRPALMAEVRHRTVAGNEGRFIAHRPQLLGDRLDQLLLIAAFEIP